MICSLHMLKAYLQYQHTHTHRVVNPKYSLPVSPSSLISKGELKNICQNPPRGKVIQDKGDKWRTSTHKFPPLVEAVAEAGAGAEAEGGAEI